jgi:hypothetical protein
MDHGFDRLTQILQQEIREDPFDPRQSVAYFQVL